MDIVLNRKGGVPVKEQLARQLEMEILAGSLSHGQKLPSVRALARRLRIHHNTVSAAYQDLEGAGHVELKRGAGVYVRSSGPTQLREARGLDEMIRFALRSAFDKGYSGAEIRVAVEQWLAGAPPDRVVVVDPAPEMAELMRHEIGVLGLPVETTTPAGLAADASLLSGALGVCLPYHGPTIQRMVPGAALEEVMLEVGTPERRAIAALPAGSIVLVVSHSPTVLPFASVFIRSLRGDEVLVEAHLLSETKSWRRVVPAADLVLADVMSAALVRRSKPRKLQEFRMITAASLDAVREALKTSSPRARRG